MGKKRTRKNSTRPEPMSGPPYGKYDPELWARYFKQVFPKNPVDEDTMTGWFANAQVAAVDEMDERWMNQQRKNRKKNGRPRG